MHTFDLEERTFQFCKLITAFCKKLPKDISTWEFSKQLIRAAGSVGANYIEANEALSKKDLLMRLKISRKEAKECLYWIRLIIESNEGIEDEDLKLLQEARELKNILSTIIQKVSF